MVVPFAVGDGFRAKGDTGCREGPRGAGTHRPKGLPRVC